MVVLSILTDETSSMPWDDLYSILTPDLRFNMFFNHANFMHGTGAQKQGSVIMVYGGGRRARALPARPRTRSATRSWPTSTTCTRRCGATSPRPGCKSWEHAGPFAAPGRWRGQAALERASRAASSWPATGLSEFVSMETAALTAVDAAAHVRRVLGATPAAA